jgi:hypothetical protein
MMRDLGTYQPAGALPSCSLAEAINNIVQVSGNIESAGVVLDLNSVFSDYPPSPAETFILHGSSEYRGPNYAEDINNSGMVVGWHFPVDWRFAGRKQYAIVG